MFGIVKYRYFSSTRPIPILISLCGPQRYRYRYWYRQLGLSDTDTDTSIASRISAIPIPILGIGGQSIVQRYRYQQYHPSLMQRVKYQCAPRFATLRSDHLNKECIELSTKGSICSFSQLQLALFLVPFFIWYKRYYLKKHC